MQKCAVEFGFILTSFDVPTTRLLISIEETAGFVHRKVLARVLDVKFLLYLYLMSKSDYQNRFEWVRV